MPAYNYPLQKQLASIRDVLENQWTIAKQQPLVKMAGAGMDAVGKIGQTFDQLYRGNVGTEPVNQGQVQVPASEQAVAGIPFGPGKTVYHGTSKLYDKMNPYYNNPNDLFGKMTHFAEDPMYAGNDYSGVGHFVNATKPTTTAEEAYFGSLDPLGNKKVLESLRPRVIPARLDVKNALDVSSNNPTMINWDDLDKFLRITLRESPEFLSGQLRGLEKMPKQMQAAMQGNRSAVGAEYINKANKMPRDLVESKLKGNPLGLSDSGFDAIKYSDNIAAAGRYRPEVWAIENPALAKSTITGEPLGINLKPRNLERLLSMAQKSPSEEMMMESPIYQYINEHPITDYSTIVERVAKRYQDRIKSMGYSKNTYNPRANDEQLLLNKILSMHQIK